MSDKTTIGGLSVIDRIKEIRGTITGIITRQESEFLYNTAERTRPGLYADLGTLQGLSASFLALGMKDRNLEGSVITVDTFQGETLKEYWIGKHGEEGVRKRMSQFVVSLEQAQEYWRTVGSFDRITPHMCTTTEASVLHADDLFDFIFIDADHSYEGVSTDYENWSPLLKLGGEIAFHDSYSKKHNVWKLMQELPGKGWRMTSTCGSIQAWRKE